jgi:flavin reductase (DIM6/NTAB) family NADH-FMN oxidoreductase RutF
MTSRPAPFPKVVAQLDYPMFIVTTAADGERSGCLVGFATQVSIHPPRFLACVSCKNHTYRVGVRANVMVVHFVPEDEEGLAELFGGETGDEIDKFERCDWSEGPDGVPVIRTLENWFAGRVLERYEFGDHVGFVLDPIEGEAGQGHETLTFRRAKWIEPGHEP